MEDIYTFSYTLEDLSTIDCNGHWQSKDENVEGSFDKILKLLWDRAQEEGLFRYKYDRNPLTKIMQSPFNFIIQLNPERATKRRKPQEISCPNQPFNPNDFNFNKINPKEILIKFKSLEDQSISIETGDNYIIINTSPLEYGHVLLVPQSSKNQPQKITKYGLKLAIEMLLLNHSRDFRVGFNSLCAYASVNHHHYHGYYLDHRLFIEHAELKQIIGPCYQICAQNYPAPGFVFVLEKSHCFLNPLIAEIWKLVSYLQQENIAHNMFITRGSTKNLANHFDSIRIFIWGRNSSYGSKECDAFNPAMCEFSGHFVIKSAEIFGSITEDLIFKELRFVCSDVYNKIFKAVFDIYSKD